MAAKRYSKSRKRSATTRRRKKNKKVSRLAWLFGGLLMGVTIAVGGYVLFNKINTAAPSAQTVANTDVVTTTQQKEVVTTTQATKEQTNTRPETSAETKKSQYDFYTLLPEMDVQVPDTAPTNSRGGKQRYSYVLQAGSFRVASEADSVKAQLALLGVQASIQTLLIKDKVWHRVKLGPYNSWDEVKPVRRHLKDNNINFSIIKSKRD